MFCMECGTKLPNGAKFCMNCGTKVGETGNTASAVSAARGCTPGKKYKAKMMNSSASQKDFKNIPTHEMSESDIYLWYTKLDDGTIICWVYDHIPKYAQESNYYYNLYRWDTDGTATFLDAGSRSGIEEMYVLDGYAYWNDWDETYRVNIYEGGPAENVN